MKHKWLNYVRIKEKMIEGIDTEMANGFSLIIDRTVVRFFSSVHGMAFLVIAVHSMFQCSMGRSMVL